MGQNDEMARQTVDPNAGPGWRGLWERPYFFDGGLRFECQKCGACCSGAPGIVRVEDSDLPRLTTHLGLTHHELISRYLRRDNEGWILRERTNGDCALLEETKRCAAYLVRPRQCRTYPFWPQTVRSDRSWRETGRSCPGVDRGRKYQKDEIIALLGVALGPEKKDR